MKGIEPAAFEAMLDAAVATVSDVIAEAGIDRLDEFEQLELSMCIEQLLEGRK